MEEVEEKIKFLYLLKPRSALEILLDVFLRVRHTEVFLTGTRGARFTSRNPDTVLKNIFGQSADQLDQMNLGSLLEREVVVTDLGKGNFDRHLIIGIRKVIQHF